MSISKCNLYTLPKIQDLRGNLSFIESSNHIPFEIKRVYYLYDIPGGLSRGAHAHKNLHQLIIALSGSFEVIIDDGILKSQYYLNKPFEGLYVCPMIWRELINFSSGSVCMVLASECYEEDDYIRDYDEFKFLHSK